MTRRLKPGRFAILLLCLLLGLFFAAEAAHGHAGTADHCQLCLLTHAVALLPALFVLPLALRLQFRVERLQPRRGSRFRVCRHCIRPPPVLA